MKFLAVGFLNTLFGYSVFSLLIYLELHYGVASLLSTIVGVLFNFKTTGKIVFNNSNNNLLYRFIGVYTLIYFVNIGLLRIFDILNVGMYEAGAILILPIACLSFYLNKTLVFRG